MAISLSLYKNFPQYVKYMDEVFGESMLSHFSGAVQPQLEDFWKTIQKRHYFLDPLNTPAKQLDWLQQVVGSAPVENRWQGLGINPAWPHQVKRRYLRQIWLYWQMKGTEWGWREGVTLWLQYPAHDNSRMDILRPFGQTETALPPAWWGYGVPYNHNRTRSFLESRRLGSGDYAGWVGQPRWVQFSQPEYRWKYGKRWNQGWIKKGKPDSEPTRQQVSAMGPNNIWQIFNIATEDEWRNIVPDVFAYNLESLSTNAKPNVFLWLQPDTSPAIALEEDPESTQIQVSTEHKVDGHKYGDAWIYKSRGPSVRTVEQSGNEMFGIWPGAQWGQRWGASGGTPVQNPNYLQTEEIITGVWPGTQWGQRWGGRFQREQHQPRYTPSTATPPDNPSIFLLGKIAKWGQRWVGPYSQMPSNWVKPLENIVDTVVESGAIASSPWYGSAGIRIVSTDQSEIIPSPPIPHRRQWVSQFREIEFRRSIQLEEPAVACRPGMIYPVQVGEEPASIEHDEIVSSQAIRVIPSHKKTIIDENPFEGILPLNAFRYGRPWNTSGVPKHPAIDTDIEIDLSGLDSLSGVVDFIDSVEADEEYNFVRDPHEVILQKENQWHFGTGGITRTEVIEETERYEFKHPIGRATYFSYRHQWDSKVIASISKEVAIPVFRDVRLCNVFKNWSRRVITEIIERQIELPPDDQRKLYPRLSLLEVPHNWQLLLETHQSLIQLKPTTYFWSDDEGNRGLRWDEQKCKLNLEFVFQPQVPDSLRSAALVTKDFGTEEVMLEVEGLTLPSFARYQPDKLKTIDARSFSGEGVPLDPLTVHGFRFMIVVGKEATFVV